jgi:hypothetical protein
MLVDRGVGSVLRSLDFSKDNFRANGSQNNSNVNLNEASASNKLGVTKTTELNAKIPGLFAFSPRDLGNPWAQSPFKRGQDIDEGLGNNLGKNFPSVDILDPNGVLISIKSLETNSMSYQTESGMFNQLKKDIDTLKLFVAKSWNVTNSEGVKELVIVDQTKYNSKKFLLAIPERELNTGQLEGIRRAVNHANGLGIAFEIVVVS